MSSNSSPKTILQTSPNGNTHIRRDMRWPSVCQSAVTSGTSAVESCSTRHTRGQVWPRKEGAWCNPNKRCKRFHRSYDSDAEKQKKQKKQNLTKCCHESKTTLTSSSGSNDDITRKILQKKNNNNDKQTNKQKQKKNKDKKKSIKAWNNRGTS